MNLLQSMLQAGLLNNTGKSLQLKKYMKNQDVNYIFQNAVDDIILKEDKNTKLSEKLNRTSMRTQIVRSIKTICMS